MVITIDGPVASGKSSIARLLAQELNFYYLNSGLIFRACAFILTKYCLIPVEQLMSLSRAQISACLDLTKLMYRYVDGHEHIFYEGKEITPLLKTKEIDHVASIAGTNPCIREIILDLEHAIAQNYNVVCDGRDMGTIVFPRAALKIYLTASKEMRANRWCADQKKQGNLYSEKEALQEIERRDQRDATRLVAPLTMSPDAITVDNSHLNKEQTLAAIKKLVNQLS